MKIIFLSFVFAAGCSAAMAQLAPPPRPANDPLSNTYVTAAESTLDAAEAVDLGAAPAALDSQMANLKTTRTNLASMAYTDNEKLVLSAIDSLMFTLTSCRIQAIDGTDLTACKTHLLEYRHAAEETLGKHKSEGTWKNGPPSTE
ncbi:MAG: hypothetical protein PW792_11955 [Acidobacteriaceae bacterium]|nr:hypothetical protein [Acidobacteriaceae bacterium]